jgi:hypothetical protein
MTASHFYLALGLAIWLALVFLFIHLIERRSK